RNCQPALHRGAGETALEPRRHVLQGVELDEVAGAIKPDQVADPAQHGDVGDGVVIVHDPLPAVEARLQHPEQAFGLVAIALERAFGGDLAAGELVEVAELAEHWTDEGHLEEHPLDRLVTARRLAGHESAGLVSEVEEDGTGLEQGERITIGTVRVKDRRGLAVRVEREKLRAPGFVLADVDQVRLVGQAQLLERDRNLDPVRRRQRVELEAGGRFCRPGGGGGGGGKIRDKGALATSQQRSQGKKDRGLAAQRNRSLGREAGPTSSNSRLPFAICRRKLASGTKLSIVSFRSSRSIGAESRDAAIRRLFS